MSVVAKISDEAVPSKSTWDLRPGESRLVTDGQQIALVRREPYGDPRSYFMVRIAGRRAYENVGDRWSDGDFNGDDNDGRCSLAHLQRVFPDWTIFTGSVTLSNSTENENA